MSDLTLLNFVAYLDPGTGSLLVQFLLGAIVGSGVWFRKHVIATVARLLRFGRKSSEEASGEARPETAAEPVEETTDESPATAAPAAEVSGEAEEERAEETESLQR